jgi:hypothetical protein
VQIAPFDAVSGIPGAIGIGCTDERPCPRLPNAPADLRSRCVYVRVEAMQARGVCTYFADPRDDRSCLVEGADANVCLQVTGSRDASSYGWEHGDCDGDGLINKLDPRVCSELEVIGVVSTTASGAFATCEFGDVDATRCGEVSELSPGHYGCAESGDLTPFAFCCDTHADCPLMPDLGSTLRPRCVRIVDAESTDGLRGACTYDEITRPDDRSCEDTGALPIACFATGEATSYGSWAAGDCEGDCDDANQTDPFVCDCPAPGEDAGPVDAGANVEGDAAVGPEVDAASAALDGALADDAGVLEPSFFAGSGCRCAAGRRGPSPTHALGLGLLGLALVARALGARRRPVRR